MIKILLRYYIVKEIHVLILYGIVNILKVPIPCPSPALFYLAF